VAEKLKSGLHEALKLGVTLKSLTWLFKVIEPLPPHWTDVLLGTMPLLDTAGATEGPPEAAGAFDAEPLA